MFGHDVSIVTKRKESPPPTPPNTEPQAPMEVSVMRNRFGPDQSDFGNMGAADGNSSIQMSCEQIETEPILVLGMDISHFSRENQFAICATGVFGFTLLYGYLQELISVHILDRQLGLFLACAQFAGYSAWAILLRNFVAERRQTMTGSFKERPAPPSKVPFLTYLGLSILRAVDLGLTNLAMQFVNYPAKTLIKSSRVVFTMMFGVVLYRKKYRIMDYMIICLMVSGLVIFMHADANSAAVFDSRGVIMLIASLACDGAVSNISEKVMMQYGVGQDEYIFNLYSVALVAITAAAAFGGDLVEGFQFLSQPGSYNELSLPYDQRTWSVASKWSTLILFSTMGFFGASCSAAITKHFGALMMSITSTARKATTVFLSFALFDNQCSLEHIAGIVLFVSSLIWKSLSKARSGKGDHHHHQESRRKIITLIKGTSDLEMGVGAMPVVFSGSAGLEKNQETVPFLVGSDSEDSLGKELKP